MKAKWSGGIPYGLKFDRSINGLVINKSEEKTLKIILKLAETHTIIEIVDKLRNMNILTRRGGMWAVRSVSYILNPERIKFYQGIDSEGHPGNWPVLIESNTANKILEKFGKLGTGKGRSTKPKSLLTGLDIAKCAYCKGGLKVSYSKAKDHINLYYKCVKKEMYGIGYCPDSKLFRMEKVNQAIITDLLDQYLNKKNIIKYTEDYVKRNRALLKEKLNLINDKITQSLTKQLSASFKDFQILEEKILSLLEERKGIAANIYFEFDFTNLKNISRMEIEKQREILPLLIKEIIIHNDYLDITYNFSIDNEGNNTVRKNYILEEIER